MCAYVSMCLFVSMCVCLCLCMYVREQSGGGWLRCLLTEPSSSLLTFTALALTLTRTLTCGSDGLGVY